VELVDELTFSGPLSVENGIVFTNPVQVDMNGHVD